MNRIKELRGVLGLNQAELAEKLGIQKSLVSEYESDKKEPSKAVLIAMIEKLQVSANWLLTGKGSMFIEIEGVKMNHILDRIREVIISTGLNDSEFARQAGIAQSTFANMFSRGSEPRAEVLSKIVINFKVDANWLLTGEGTMFTEGEKEAGEGNMRIPVLGSTVTGKGAAEKYLKPSELLPSLSAASLCAYRMNDTSMAGAGIEEGDIILFDAASACHADDLYVFALNGTVYCKLLKFDTIRKTIKIYSLHTPAIKHAEELRTLSTASPEGQEILHIFGKVVAWLRGNRLITR